MIKLRSLENVGGKPTVKFSEWVAKKKSANESVDGRYLVVVVMAPAKYPSASVIFETETERVKLSLSKDVWDVVKGALGLKPSDYVGQEIYVVIENGDVNLDTAKPSVEGKECVYSFSVAKKIWTLTYVDANASI